MGEKTAKERILRSKLVKLIANGTNSLRGVNVAQKEPWKELELSNMVLPDLEAKTAPALPKKSSNVPLTVDLGNGLNGLLA